MNLALKLFLATRPAFLTITLVGCFIGLATPSASKASLAINCLALVLALFAHAAANLLNDYFDHLNGCDQMNEDRISPFTGGSRYIQEGLLEPKQMLHLSQTLMLLSVFIGLYICSQTTWLLIPLGFFGMVVAWSYSAPPLELMSKGAFGELAIAMTWSLIVIGFASIQKNAIAYEAIPIGMAYGLMISNILLVNQIPDIKADQLANKLTLATQITSRDLSVWYMGIMIAAYIMQIIGIYCFSLPKGILLSILPLPLFLYCAKEITNVKGAKEKLRKLIVCNLVAIHLYSLLLFIGLLID